MSDTALNAAIEPIEFAYPARANASATPLDGAVPSPVERAGGTILLHLSLLLTPVIGLAIILLLPLVGLGAVVWVAGKGVVRRLAPAR